MGRSKKKHQQQQEEHHNDDDSTSGRSDTDEASPPAAAPTAAPAATADALASAPVSGERRWVEVRLSGKKKPTTLIRGLEAYGLKLPATAAQLKKMLGPTEVVKDKDLGDHLEATGDVETAVRELLVSKFNVAASDLTANIAASVAAEAAARAAATSGSAGGDGAADGAAEGEDGVTITRKADPVVVVYCPVCTFPAEMCEYSGMFEACKPWLAEHLAAEEAAALADAEEKGRKRRVLTEQDRIDKLLAGKGKKKVEQSVVLDCKTRSGKKRVTIITGLDLFGLNLTDISREFKKLFSCGAGIVEEPGQLPAVEVQGDVVSQLLEILPAKYGIPTSALYYMDGKTKVAADS